MRREARNLERFREDFADDPGVVFPRPVHPWVTDSVLVEDFEVTEDQCRYLAKEREERPNAVHFCLYLHLEQ